MQSLNLLILLALSTLVSCSMFERRDFAEEMDEYRFDEPMFRANRDFMVLSGDSGRDHRSNSEIRGRTPATVEENHLSLYEKGLKRELNHLEFRMNEDEFQEFDRMRDQIGTVSEQIYFLRLSHLEREEYLALRKIKTPNGRKSRGYSAYGPQRIAFHKVKKPLITNDVTLGMSQDKVIQNWGSPDRREVAGNPNNGNERWAFRKKGVVKYIYFEGGKVQGWSEAPLNN